MRGGGASSVKLSPVGERNEDAARLGDHKRRQGGRLAADLLRRLVVRRGAIDPLGAFVPNVDNDLGRGKCSLIDGTGSSPLDGAAHALVGGTYYIQVNSPSVGAAGQFNYKLAITVRSP